MAYSLLDAINATLKRANYIQGSSGELSSLTSSGRQHKIDTAVQVWNELIDELYTRTRAPRPNEAASTTITLVSGSAGRSYSLPTDLVEIRYPLIDSTNKRTIDFYPGGYEQMRQDQLDPRNWTGRPFRAAINPTNGKLRVDRDPGSDAAGSSYNLLYDKRINVTDGSDTFPFHDDVVDALVPCAAEMLRLNEGESFREGVFKINFGRASRLLNKNPPRDVW